MIFFCTIGHANWSLHTGKQVVAMHAHEQINYVEFPANDLERTKAFFETAFGWSFVDYGPEYAAFSDQGLDGGFYKSDLKATTDRGSALIVLFSESLEETQAKVMSAGGQIVRPIFPFPGGRRFHFIEPSGNELAVWGETRPSDL
jgi:predicted enzyme related to lactoylglutathione lyase